MADNKNEKKYKALIVAASPYCDSSQSRIFNTYFGTYKRENLSQLYTRNIIPNGGKCSTFYCLSDEMILRKRLKPKKQLGHVYNYPFNSDEDARHESKLRSIGKKKSAIRYLLRNILWGERIWKDAKILDWAKKISPDFVFLSVADDFYLNKIALWIADQLGIPLFLNIVDDYFFNLEKSINPLYLIYKNEYRIQIKNLFSKARGVVYISEKMKDKYSEVFATKNIVLPISSNINSAFKVSPSSSHIRKLLYFGSLEPGRYKTLSLLSKSIKKEGTKQEIFIYSGEERPRILNCLNKHGNIKLVGTVDYYSLLQLIKTFDAILLCESFEEKDIRYTRLALSTKTCDSLCFPIPLIYYGPQESGCYAFLKQFEDSCLLITDPKNPVSPLSKYIIDNHRLDIKRRATVCSELFSEKKCNDAFNIFLNELMN